MSYNGYVRDEWGVHAAQTGPSPETLGCVLAIAIFAVIVAVITIPAYFLTSYSCQINAEKMGFEYDWGVLTGCKIKVNEHYIDIDKYRGI